MDCRTIYMKYDEIHLRLNYTHDVTQWDASYSNNLSDTKFVWATQSLYLEESLSDRKTCTVGKFR